MNYQTLNLIDQVYTNIDIEINDKKLISNNENKTINEVIYTASKIERKTKKQLARDQERLELKQANLYKIKHAQEIQLIKNRFINN